MKALGTIFSLLIVLLLCSEMAVADRKPEDVSTTYILVDASGTMDGLVDDAKAKMNMATDMVRPDQNRSITFFGASPDNERALTCGDPVTIGPKTSPDDPLPAFPTLGRRLDKTSIGGAVETILDVADELDQIVLITDRREECGADFERIRRKNPTVPIFLIPVGSYENLDLEKLKILEPLSKPERLNTHEVNFQGPFVQLSSGSKSRRNNLWQKANWLERYLWVLCYACFCLSAFLLSLSFGEKIKVVKGAIDKLETFKRNLADQATKEDGGDAGKLPEYLKDEEILRSGKAFSIRSKWMLSYAVALGAPLAILDGAIPIAFWSVSVLVVIVSIFWMSRDIRAQAKPTKRSIIPDDKKITNFLRQHENLILGMGLIALVSAVHLLADFDRARGAAWVPLSSGFSAALTLVASTPFLSAGARWLELQSEKRSYYILGDGATREEVRRKKEEQREIDRIWRHYQGTIRQLELKNPKLTSRLVRTRREANFEAKLATVLNRLKEHLIAAGGREPSASANVLYQQILRKLDWGSLSNAILNVSGLVPQEEAKLWDAFEKSLKSWWRTSEIEGATFKLARYLDKLENPDDHED